MREEHEVNHIMELGKRIEDYLKGNEPLQEKITVSVKKLHLLPLFQK
jgi:hypothetical protein